jgi:2-succinyl-6-hydroxy-2,4-cyclohexadiene-1-carboxylate synthase
MRITTDDHVELAVEVVGDGPGLLLVHGFGGAKEDFADHVARLAQTNTVVTFDHRGHGASDKPDDPSAYTLNRLALDTLCVADATNLATFRLLGFSMGGAVARKVVIHAPARVDALIMMDTSAGPVPSFDPSLMEIGAAVALNEGKDSLLELLELTKPLETPAHRRVVAERPGYKEYCDKKEADMSAVMWGTLLLEQAYQSDDLAALAAALRGPLLVLVGDQDEPFLEVAQPMADAVGDARVVVIPNAGHSPQFENPDAWITAMTEFLASVDA